jgi:predicted nucleotidyltransferase
MLIEPILGYKSSWRILELLLETPRKLVSRKDLFQHTMLGNAPLSQGLKRLVMAGILVKEKKGKKEMYYINEANEYSRLIAEIWKCERKSVRNLDYDIKSITAEFVRMALDSEDITEIILFGSWAKGTASVRSDIDIAVVFEKDKRGEVELTRITHHLEKRWDKEIQVHCFTKKSFRAKTTLVKEIKDEGIWLIP